MSFATMIVLPIFEVIENPSYLDLTIPALKSTVNIATAKRVALRNPKRGLIFLSNMTIWISNENDYMAYLDIFMVK
jgi:hypothetical protein